MRASLPATPCPGCRQLAVLDGPACGAGRPYGKLNPDGRRDDDPCGGTRCTGARSWQHDRTPARQQIRNPAPMTDTIHWQDFDPALLQRAQAADQPLLLVLT